MEFWSVYTIIRLLRSRELELDDGFAGPARGRGGAAARAAGGACSAGLTGPAGAVVCASAESGSASARPVARSFLKAFMQFLRESTCLLMREVSGPVMCGEAEARRMPPLYHTENAVERRKVGASGRVCVELVTTPAKQMRCARRRSNARVSGEG